MATESSHGCRKYAGRYGTVFLGDLFKSEAAAAEITICFTQQIVHGRDRLQMASLPTLHKLPRPWGLNLGVYNTHDCRCFGLAQAIWAVQLGNYYLMIMT